MESEAQVTTWTFDYVPPVMKCATTSSMNFNKKDELGLHGAVVSHMHMHGAHNNVSAGTKYSSGAYLLHRLEAGTTDELSLLLLLLLRRRQHLQLVSKKPVASSSLFIQRREREAA